jgi:hypothetical protein
MAHLARRTPRRCSWLAGFTIATAIALPGCSTVRGDWSQQLDIDVVDSQERPVDGMLCQVGDGSSAKSVTTPARHVKVRRSAMPLQVACRDTAGAREAVATVKPRRERMEEALLPFGSVGVFVDHLSGALYAYPTRLQLQLGQRIVLEHGGQSQVASSEPLPGAGANLPATSPTAAATAQTTNPAASAAAANGDKVAAAGKAASTATPRIAAAKPKAPTAVPSATDHASNKTPKPPATPALAQGRTATPQKVAMATAAPAASPSTVPRTAPVNW